jgi:hypothetical protein
VIPWRIDSGGAIMEIFNLGSLGDELPRARLALLLERFSELLGKTERASHGYHWRFLSAIQPAGPSEFWK